MNEFVREVVDRVVAGGDPLTFAEARRLCDDVQPGTSESAYLQQGAWDMVREASSGYGLLYTQIGIDANPCPGNCACCSFAASVNRWAERELSLDEVLEYARIFDANGAHLISLMTTAAYDFDRYVEVIAAVREVISPNAALMINTGDFDLDQAKRMKDAGGDLVYHAVRIGEGITTSIKPQRRWDTLRAAREAGLRVSSGVEPLYRGIDLGAVVGRMFEVALFDTDLLCSGVSPLVVVEGTKMAPLEPVSEEERRIFSGIWQLVVGAGKVPFTWRNVRWADAGVSPRHLAQLDVDEERIAAAMQANRAALEAEGWTVPDRVLPIWGLYEAAARP